jgi:hypothetical protein
MMNRHLHTTLILTGDNEEVTNVTHKKATELFGGLVTNIIKSANCYCSFMVAPCGIHVDTKEELEFKTKLDEFIKWMETHNIDGTENDFYDENSISFNCSYVEVCHHLDDGGAFISKKDKKGAVVSRATE